MPERGWHVRRWPPRSVLPVLAWRPASRCSYLFLRRPSYVRVSRRTGGSTARVASVSHVRERAKGALHQKKNSTTSFCAPPSCLPYSPSSLHAITRPTWPNRLATDVRHTHVSKYSRTKLRTSRALSLSSRDEPRILPRICSRAHVEDARARCLRLCVGGLIRRLGARARREPEPRARCGPRQARSRRPACSAAAAASSRLASRDACSPARPLFVVCRSPDAARACAST